MNYKFVNRPAVRFDIINAFRILQQNKSRTLETIFI